MGKKRKRDKKGEEWKEISLHARERRGRKIDEEAWKRRNGRTWLAAQPKQTGQSQTEPAKRTSKGTG